MTSGIETRLLVHIFYTMFNPERNSKVVHSQQETGTALSLFLTLHLLAWEKADSSVQFSSVKSLDWFGGREDPRVDSVEVLFQSFLQELLWVVLAWAGMPTLDVVYPAFPLPTTSSPSLQGALKDGFGEAVVACDMPEPCEFLSLDRCQKNSCGPTRKVVLLRTQSSALCSKQEMRRSFLRHLARSFSQNKYSPLWLWWGRTNGIII